MATPSRNSPCPCGSGTKYKKCCLPKDQASSPAAAVPPTRCRVVDRGGQMMLASRGVSSAALDKAAGYFARRDRREGPASQMVRFTQPLLDAAGDDPDRMQRALNFGMAFWNLALCKGERHEQLLSDMANGLGDDAGKFRVLATDMVERHREMFPELHGGPT